MHKYFYQEYVKACTRSTPRRTNARLRLGCSMFFRPLEFVPLRRCRLVRTAGRRRSCLVRPRAMLLSFSSRGCLSTVRTAWSSSYEESSTSGESDDDDDPFLVGGNDDDGIRENVGMFWGNVDDSPKDFKPSGFFSLDGTWYESPTRSSGANIELGENGQSELQKVLRAFPISKTTRPVLPPTFVRL